MNPFRSQQSRRFSPDSGTTCRLQYHPLEPRLALAVVEVIAAGVTNQETIQLQVDGQTVRTWNNLGGDAYAGQFVSLTHTTSGALSPDRVRIAFTNDLYDPVNGVDRNVRIDALRIDGVRYETESPLVFSTGTWTPQDGIVPGFRQSEYLHTDGYFQYANDGSANGSLIVIRASGDEGGEQMELRIDGVTVSSYVVTSNFASYQYRASATIEPSRIRVAFVNDLWDPVNGIDRNLNVDWISVDGVIRETEGPNVFSTGTWVPGIGIEPGFRQSSTLHSGGYFQYETPRNFGTISLQNSVINVPENAGSAALTILRSNGSEGTVTVDFRTVATSATAGQDFVSRSGTVTFLPGEVSRTVLVSLLDDSIVEGDEQFAFTIDNVQGGAGLLAPRTATITIQDNDAIRAAGNGLLGEYFDNSGFVSRFLNRIDPTVSFDWGSSAPAAGMGVDTFSVRWTGRLEPRFSETYTFRTRTDDGVRLWINNQLIIDRWIDQAATLHTGTINLQAGVFYDLRMEYYENTGSAVAELSWSSPRQALEVIPRSQLYAAEPPPVTPGNSLLTQNLYTGLVQPTSMDFSPDGSNLYVAEQRGIIRVARNGNLLAAPFLDFRDRINGTRDRGLLDIAVHPDFINQPYVYLLYTYDPPQVNGQAAGTLAGPDGNGNRAGRLTRVTADAATNYTTIVPNSEVVIVGRNSTWNNFNAFANSTTNFSEPAAGQLPNNGGWVQDFIATDSESHTVGAVEFGPDGALYVSIGDGTSYNQVDPRTSRVQDLNNLSGKILRVDPLTGQGLASNPFFNGNPDANRSKVWQLGLRNPFRIALHPTSGKLYVGDVGWTQWEELNSAPAGANFGWPWYEGGNGNNLRTGGYQNLAAAQAFYASGQSATPAFYALNHAASGINAIVMGDVYTGNTFPARYRDNVFFGDLGQGIIRNMRFNADGSIAEVQTFATGHQYVVQMVQGPDGNLYFVDLDNGLVGRWTFVEGAANTTAAATVAPGAPLASRPSGSTQGAGVIVAAIDSGVDPEDPRLAGKLWINTREIAGDGIDNDANGLVDDRNGYDFVSGDGILRDPSGHGTFVASLMLGDGAGEASGIATGARLMSLRVLDAMGRGDSARVSAAIRYAVDQGARIITLPLSVAEESPAIRGALDWAAEQGVFVVAAAGNDGAPEPGFLARLAATLPNLLSAGALDADGHRLPESNRVGNSGAIQLDAPGIAAGSGLSGSTAVYRGTSVATALIGGAAARLLSIHPGLDARQLRQLLLASGSMAGSGSDSDATLDLEQAVSLAEQLRSVSFSVDGTRLTVRATAGDDRIRFRAGESVLEINGVGYRLAGLAGYTHVVLEGGTGSDQLTIRGSVDGSDYGLLRPGYISLTTAGQFVRGAGFEQMTLWAGSGNATVDLHDSSGDDQLTISGDSAFLSAAGSSLTATGFRTQRVFASQGVDRATMLGTPADERLLARPDFSRLVRGSRSFQANGFDLVTARLGAGFDNVIFEANGVAESVGILPQQAWLSGSGYNVEVFELERTTSYGNDAGDEVRMWDGPGRDTFNSHVLNTLMAGAGYDHRAYRFPRTWLYSRGGEDHLTLRGSANRELLLATPELTTFSGPDFVTEASGFLSRLVVGQGGEDEARLAGSSGYDYFWSSPAMSVWNAGSSSLTTQQFRQHRFDGNGGGDFVALVDDASSSQLQLQRNSATLSGAGWQVEVTGINRLRARSLLDPSPDTLQFQTAELDYQFEQFGDWQLIT